VTLCNVIGPQRDEFAHGPCQCGEPDDHRERGRPHRCATCGHDWFDAKGGNYPGPPAQRLGIVDRARRTRFWRGHR
jgi:hypothetical protein